MAGDILLELEDVHMYFGKVAALAGVSLKIRKGEIHSVIGPNGAGKTVMIAEAANCSFGPEVNHQFVRVLAQLRLELRVPVSARIAVDGAARQPTVGS